MHNVSLNLYKMVTATALSMALISQATAQDQADNGVQDLPEEWQAFVEKEQLPVHKAFAVSDNISGLLLNWEGETEMLYLVHNENLVLAGRLLTREGKQLTEEHETAHFWQNELNQVIDELDQNESLWLAEGNPDAPYIYIFDDLNCPYCNQQYESLKDLVDAGELQVRHVLVGILQDDSKVLAAKVLNAENPASLFVQYQEAFGTAGAKGLIYETVSGVTSDPRVDQAQRLMDQAGISGTPGIIVPMEASPHSRYTGVMSAGHISEILGISTTENSP